LERILQLLAEDRPPARQGQRERGVEIGSVRAALAFLPNARADFRKDRVEIDRLLRRGLHGAPSMAATRGRYSNSQRCGSRAKPASRDVPTTRKFSAFC